MLNNDHIQPDDTLFSMKPYTRAQMFRDAADVTRYHTQRMIRSQTVGAHSFNVIMLIDQVWPGCRKDLWAAAMHHDLPELHTGDIPAPIKRMQPPLGVLLERIEQDLAPLYKEFRLTVEEEMILKWADTMELTMWCLEERLMGNKWADRCVINGISWMLASKMLNPDAWVLVHSVADFARKQGIKLKEKTNVSE